MRRAARSARRAGPSEMKRTQVTLLVSVLASLNCSPSTVARWGRLFTCTIGQNTYRATVRKLRRPGSPDRRPGRARPPSLKLRRAGSRRRAMRHPRGSVESERKPCVDARLRPQLEAVVDECATRQPASFWRASKTPSGLLTNTWLSYDSKNEVCSSAA
jgi:hypothetical protein